MGSPTRRAFLGLVCATAGCAAVGGVGKAFAGEGDLLRPPGAQDESAFISACIKCDRCRSVCHTGAISLAQVEDGLINARTPVIDFHKGYCDFCDLCLKVCSTGAIRAFDETSEQIGVAVVQRDRCLSYSQSCIICSEKCPYGAISLDGGNHPVVDANVCNGCGVCEHECPALVYGTFGGGTRRGIVVVTAQDYQQIGATVTDGEGA